MIVSLGEPVSDDPVYTEKAAGRYGRPWLHVHLGAHKRTEIRARLKRLRARSLNLAEPRASRKPVYHYTMQILAYLG